MRWKAEVNRYVDPVVEKRDGAQCYPMGRDQVIMEKYSRKRDVARICSLHVGLHSEIIYVYRWLYGAGTVSS
jgi:hypothetical protein